MGAGIRRGRTRAVVGAIVAGTVVLLALSVAMIPDYYTWSPTGKARMRQGLATAFPGFGITNLEGYDTYPWSHFPWGTPNHEYHFRLLSTRTDGFGVAGTYHTDVSREQMVQDSLWSNGALSQSELQALEELWVERFPSEEALVGELSVPNPVARNWKQLEDFVDPEYGDIDPNDVYYFHSSAGRGHFFRLNATNGTWEYLPGFDTRESM